jgi:hypothetical protein
MKAQQYYMTPSYGAAQTIDISGIINAILPIMMLAMMFGMLMPMVKGMTGEMGR